MPPSSREPWDLAQRMGRRLQRVQAPNRYPVEPLLVWAAWHLNTAQLGWDVLLRAGPDGDDNFPGHPRETVEVAAENLIFRGVVSAMDLCAAAIFRLTGEPLRADRERDVGWWFDSRRSPPWQMVPRPLGEWLRVLEDNAIWTMATELTKRLHSPQSAEAHNTGHRWRRPRIRRVRNSKRSLRRRREYVPPRRLREATLLIV